MSESPAKVGSDVLSEVRRSPGPVLNHWAYGLGFSEDRWFL